MGAALEYRADARAQVRSTLSSVELDFADDVCRVFADQADAGDDSIALGVCTHGDCRVGPLREVERHLGAVCVRRALSRR